MWKSPPVSSRELVNKLFGARLKAARLAMGMTQTNLAGVLGLSRVTVANLESGGQNVQLHQVFSIAEALQTSVERLIPRRVDVEREKHEGARVRTDRLESSDRLFLSLAHNQLFNSDE